MKKLFLKSIWKKGVILVVLSGLVMISLSGCVAPSKQAPTSEKQLTVGVVQKEIKKGMSQAEVAEILGSPNIVTRDKEGIETWIYDKIASEASYSSGGFGINLIIASAGQATERASQTQRTLTVIIKFKDGVVYDFSYHTSRF